MPHDQGHVELLTRGLCVVSGHVLICRNLEGGYGYLPGGHVEFGESAADALTREMVEEAGEAVRVGPCVLVAETAFTQHGKRRHELNLVFHMELERHPPTRPTGRTLERVVSREASIGFEWIRADQLHGEDIRPAWIRTWLAARSDNVRMLPGFGTPCEWLSRLEG